MAEARVPALCSSSGSREQDHIADWLVTALSEALQMDPRAVRRDVPLWEYGVDSLVAATLIAEVEDELGVWLDPLDVPPGISLDELARIVLENGQPTGEEHSDVA